MIDFSCALMIWSVFIVGAFRSAPGLSWLADAEGVSC